MLFDDRGLKFLCDDDDCDCPEKDSLGKVLIVVAFTTIVTALVTWGVDELKEKFGSKPPSKSDPDKKP